MTTRRRTTPPVPMSPIHRRSWRSLWRRCSCGLKEPCIDRLTTAALYLPTDPPTDLEPPPPPPPFAPHAMRPAARADVRASPPPDPRDPRSDNLPYRAEEVDLGALPNGATGPDLEGPSQRAARPTRHDPPQGIASPSFEEQPGRTAPLNLIKARSAEPQNDEYADVVFLNRAARPPSTARMRHSASARVPTPQAGRAGSLTPAQSRRADHAERRQDVPTLREAVPGPPQSPPHQPSRGAGQLPERNRPGPARNRAYEGRRVDDTTT